MGSGTGKIDFRQKPAQPPRILAKTDLSGA
jgi:hypothetical protein